ncbi:MAG: hypothetical protein WCF38_12170, partial [Pseudolabrys sp.]
MSALGHKRTFAVQKGMSALPLIADIGLAIRGLHSLFGDEPVTSYLSLPALACGSEPPVRRGQHDLPEM